MDIVISIISLVGFILLTASTGLFVAVEFALTGLERSTIDDDIAQRNDKSAQKVKNAFHNLSFVLSGAQLGITITTLATGYLAEPILASYFGPLLELLHIPQSATTSIALVLALIVATTLSMVFGELVPKNIAITNPMDTARIVIGPVNFFNACFSGFIKLLNSTANRVVRKMGIEPSEELASARSTQELTALVRNSAKTGGLEKTTALMLDRSLKFGNSTAEELMTPRSTVESLAAESTVTDLITRTIETGHSRFPIIRGDLDDTVGVVHYKDAFSVPKEDRDKTQLKELARPIPVVPASLDGDSVLDTVRSTGSQIILVADEYGGTAGLITIEDVVEEILGEVYDEHDDAEAERDFHKFGSSWSVSGLVRLDELEEKIDYSAPQGPYETLGGLVMAQLGRIPATGDELLLPHNDTSFLPDSELSNSQWLAKVAAMEDRRVDTVILSPVSDAEAHAVLQNITASAAKKSRENT
ncbi:HlyC/CorC family transporter [Corynebacterium sp. sy017]|uniref:hemolysin family protein n=1 Tax=unclassified Corynebacterium TaxID=2624378 RepID=UPI001185C6F6|nr:MULTISPECIES: hemolysin family protein [unclassified Corynebacterium]MBP3087578.1 HlyC/CorC family transporter [Corynebacterium sp. sy017]TSD92154.1 HlyC/CorC family transporter [Corynebacterium sp. SY003]